MSKLTFEKMLTGGHPNSLGRTLEVVAAVQDDQAKLADLIACYESQDEVVRLRVSNALKRLTREHPDWVVPYLDHLLHKVSHINQASTQWTLANIFAILVDRMNAEQRQAATMIMKRNLHHHDWIVLNMTMQTLTEWAQNDANIKKWLLPELQRITTDPHKSVAKKAEKSVAILAK